jgi:CPA2 family monovalent cation:H+ antiporter-2
MYVARWNSRELFILSITSIGLGIGYATYLVGLSFAFGAFVAGMVLSESDYGHQALSDIIPLRDIFGLLFFTSVGMLLDPAFLFQNWQQILLLVLIIALFKGLIFYALSSAFGYINIIPIAVSLSLFQVGEFSFVIARLAITSQAIDQKMYSLILAVSVMSMVFTPFVSALATPVYKLKKRFFKFEALQTENIPHSGLKDHIVIAGGGRVGQHIAAVLTKLDISFVIIELNHQRFMECKNSGFPVIFGDMSQPTALEVSRVIDAKLLLITAPSVLTTQSVVKQAHHLKPELHIIARAEGSDQARELYENGVYIAVLPEMEAGLEIARQALLHLEIPTPAIRKYTDTVRQHLYAPICQLNSDDQVMATLDDINTILEISWMKIGSGSPLILKSIKEAAVRSHTGASIVGIIHEDNFISNPSADYVFHEGDMVAIVGNQKERNKFKSFANVC